MDIWMVLVYVRAKGDKPELTYPEMLTSGLFLPFDCRIAYSEEIAIRRQDDFFAVAFSRSFVRSFSLLACLFLFLSAWLIATDDERLRHPPSLPSFHHQGQISCSIEDQFAILSPSPRSLSSPSGVTGLLLFVYIRMIAQALTCKLPMARCTCNSFSTSLNSQGKRER